MKKYCASLLVLALWLSLTVWAWVKPAEDFSDAERRTLAQKPTLSWQTLRDGSFMSDFADYAVDQFPLRDRWRSLNVLRQVALGQQDNNGLYLWNGYLAKMEYPLNETYVHFAAQRFHDLYETYFPEQTVYFAIVPDKNFYLSQESGRLAMDYDALYSTMAQELPWAEFVDLTDCLTTDSYYRTDTHWRQECLEPVVSRLGEAMDFDVAGDWTVTTPLSDFRGVYYGQSALPLSSEPLSWVIWDGWEECVVHSYDNNLDSALYDEAKLQSKDPYESFLSGNMAIQTITNPNAPQDKRLILFRDSFGSSLAPLLAQAYGEITLIDTRYVSPALLGEYVDFSNADILMMYSTLVLNSSSALRK